MPPPLDAAALAELKARLQQIGMELPWRREHYSDTITSPDGGEFTTHDDCATAAAIVATMNAAPALVAGCETLLKVMDWIEAPDDAIRDCANGSRQSDCHRNQQAQDKAALSLLLGLLNRFVAALDAAREEPRD